MATLRVLRVALFRKQSSPGDAHQANWLPAPDGPFIITLRFFWPKPVLLDGKWKTPAIKRVK